MRLADALRRPLRSLRARLIVSVGAIATLVFGLAGGALYLALAHQMKTAERSELYGKQSLVAHFIEEASPETDLAALKHRIDEAVLVHGHLRVWLLSERAEVVVGSGELPSEVSRSGELLNLLAGDGVPLEGIFMPVASRNFTTLGSMLVAIDVGPRLRLLARYRWMLWLVCGLGVLTIVGLAAWATGQGLNPVRRLSEQASRISPTSLSTRLELTFVDIELKDLVQGFNSALDRVEVAYRQMESFTADVAHELRTPLATLINAAEVTLAEQRSPESLRETLADQLEDLEQLKGLIVDMLFLARADQGDQARDAHSVALSEEVLKTVEYYEALLSDAGLAVVVEGDAFVRCNGRLIRRAISNLLSNAIKQTQRGGVIRFGIRIERESCIVEVFNPGMPLSDEVRTRMFDRFFRADPARSERGTSHGLGLAIVKAIAEMHGGRAFASPNSAGNTIGFRIPMGHNQEPTSAAIGGRTEGHRSGIR